MEVVFASEEEGYSPVEAIMVVEKSCDGGLEEVAEESSRWCVGACWIPDVAVDVSSADGWAFGGL